MARGPVRPEAHPFALPAPVTEDFTEELIAALAAGGKQYAVASRHDNNFTLAFPIFTGGTSRGGNGREWRDPRA